MRKVMKKSILVVLCVFAFGIIACGMDEDSENWDFLPGYGEDEIGFRNSGANEDGG